MLTALLTGASGFTGRLMKQALQARGISVISLQSDLTNKEAIKDELASLSVDWVIHLAALSFVGEQDLAAFYRVNVVGTTNLLEVLSHLKKKPSRILIVSSANIYGIPNQSVIDEQVVPMPMNHYACSKVAMEYMVQPWMNQLPIIIPRPFNYTGVGQDERFVIPKIVQHFAKKLPVIELGNLEVSRDFSDVRDVITAYIHLLESDACGIKVNICSGRAVSLKEILNQISQIAGYEIEVRINPVFVRANEIPSLHGDNRLLKSITGFVPEIPIQDTLQQMFNHLTRECDA